jgi:hypothetical protein
MKKLHPQRTRLELKAILGLLLAIVVAGAVVGASTASSTGSSPRSGALHVTKECSDYSGQAGSFCTITSSNIPQIKPGMRVVYLQPLGQNGLDSDIVLSAGHGSAGFGHVLLNATTSQVTFWGGTGSFTGFVASAVVSVDSSGLWHWDGTYSVSPRDADEDD